MDRRDDCIGAQIYMLFIVWLIFSHVINLYKVGHSNQVLLKFDVVQITQAFGRVI